MNTSPKSLYLGVARQFLYLVLLTLIVIVFWKIGDVYKNAAVVENGIFEILQSVVLALVSLSFGISAIKNASYRPILFLMSMMALAALIREQDAFFDELMPAIGWAWCWIFPFAGIAAIIRRRNTIQPEINDFLASNSFHMMVTAAIIMIPIAQCLGHRSFLVDLLNNKMYDAVLVRRILEETVEIIAYLVLLLASVETFFEFRKK